MQNINAVVNQSSWRLIFRDFNTLQVDCTNRQKKVYCINQNKANMQQNVKFTIIISIFKKFGSPYSVL